MSTTTLPNIRVSSDLTVRVRLKDGGVYIDWSTLNNIKAHIYSDAQRALAGRCDVSVDAEDSTLLVCSYAANKPQYVGINRIVVSAKYMGETKTYDKPAFNFVRWTADQEGEEITIDDPDVDVEIEVEDVTSSILQEAIDAALQAAADAEHAAHLVPLEVLQDCEQATADALEAAATANAAGIDEVQATVDAQVGTPSVDVDLENKVLSLDFHNMKGETGEAAGFGTASASFTEDGGDPGVTVSASGPDTAKQFAFTFKNLKGDKGDKGDQGNTGSSVDYPYELVNNCTTNDATKGLAASQGVALAGEVSQLEAEVHNLSGKYYGLFESENDLPEGDTPGYAFVGAEVPFSIYNFDGEDWFDTGAVAQAIYGEPGVGLQTVTSLQDGTVVLTLTNGDTVTMNLNHNHPQYPKYVLCETLADYNAITTKDAATLYLIPGEAVYLGDVLIVRSGSPLPYTPVSYIETDGTAYIDTGIKGNAPKSSEMKLTPLSEGAFTTHLGARDGNNRFLLVCQWGNAGGYAYDSHIAYGYGPGASQGLSMADTLSNHTPIVVRTKMAAGSQYFGIKQDGESSYTDTTATNASTVTTALNIYIFASNQDGSVAQHASNGVKVYYCKIFSDTNFTTPVFDGVPCVYNGEYGLWDKVSDTFFGNAAGSGAFTGPQI